jgi:hypothetical protein
MMARPRAWLAAVPLNVLVEQFGEGLEVTPRDGLEAPTRKLGI